MSVYRNVVASFFFCGLLFLHHPPIVVVQWKMGCLEYEFPFFYGDFPLNHDYGGKGYTRLCTILVWMFFLLGFAKIPDTQNVACIHNSCLGMRCLKKRTMLTVFFWGSSMFLFVGKWTKTSPVCVAKYWWFSHVFNIFLWCLRGDIHGKPWRVVFGLSRSFFRGWFCSCWPELCVFPVIWHSPFVVASCINSWRIIASGIRIDLEGKNVADRVPRFLNSKMSSSITQETRFKY